MGRVPQTTKVQEMIDAAVIGDGGANVKSGVSTGPFGEEKQVDFVTPFLSIPNVVIASTAGKLVGITEVTATYFKWKDWQYSGEMTVHWIATTAGNS